MANTADKSMRPWARDHPQRNETIQRVNQPTSRATNVPYTSAAATMKPARTGSFVKPDGINDIAEQTNNNQAPSQYSRS